MLLTLEGRVRHRGGLGSEERRSSSIRFRVGHELRQRRGVGRQGWGGVLVVVVHSHHRREGLLFVETMVVMNRGIGRGPRLLTLLLQRSRRLARGRRGRRRGGGDGRDRSRGTVAIKGHHDHLHEGFDRDMARRGGGALLLGLCGRMDAHVSRQLVRAREALLAGRERALVGALSSVGANVAGLVLKTVEGLWADVAFVWARGILATAGHSCGGGRRHVGRRESGRERQK